MRAREERKFVHCCVKRNELSSKLSDEKMAIKLMRCKVLIVLFSLYLVLFAFC